MGKINKDIYIALTTRGRINAQKTLERLVPSVRRHVTVFCHPGEKPQHIKNWGNEVADIIEYSDECRNLAQIREMIAFQAPKGKVIFMDDNLAFSVRVEGYVSPRVLNTNNFDEEELEVLQTELFNFLWDNLFKDDVAITGLSFRPFNREGMPKTAMNKRFFAIWGLDTKKYYSQGKNAIWMSDWPIKEDFATGIAMRKMGYNILITNKFAFDKTSGSNSRGGCSNYRTLEFMNSETRRMAEAFPGIVKIKVRTNKNWHGEFEGKESLDVIINWSKI